MERKRKREIEWEGKREKQQKSKREQEHNTPAGRRRCMAGEVAREEAGDPSAGSNGVEGALDGPHGQELPTRSWSLILSFSIWISRKGRFSRALVMAFWAVIRVAVLRSLTVITDNTGSQMRNWTSAPTESTAPSFEVSCMCI